MTNDPWGPGPGYPPAMSPPNGYPDYTGGYPDDTGKFGLPAPPAPPGLAITIVVTLLAGVFGVIPASMHASRAQQLGFSGGRYWKAFGITLGALLAGQLLLIGGLIAAGLFTLLPITQLGNPTGTSGGSVPAATASPPGVPPSTTGPPSLTPPPAPERTGRQEPNRNPTSVSVVTTSGGSACTTGADLSAWGAYPLANCRTWKASNGLITGAALSRKNVPITCQADLGERNPVYTAGQGNTWWVWTQADDGTWDWFPETAIAQGASDQPINGIAECQ